MAVFSINYAEDSSKKDLGYKSVQVLYGSRLRKKKVFKSGDFVADWYNCWKFMLKEIPAREQIMESSSVDHFFTDGAYKLYDPVMLHIEGNKGRLEYDDTSKGDVLLYVKKRTRPRWAIYRKLCGDPIRKE